jgi:hypothetical protein
MQALSQKPAAVAQPAGRRLLGVWPLTHLYVPILAVLTLAGFGLRILLLNHFPLREDEAIYSVWALHAWSDDFWLLHTWPDKPPLFLWLLGGAFQLFGVGQASARWLNIALSTLAIPVVAASASLLWERRAALFAAVTMAFSPFAISFASTVYTDPLLVLAGCLAVHHAWARRPFWAGLWLGAAMMTKQQGVLYAPLVAGIVCWEASTRSYSGDGRPRATGDPLSMIGGLWSVFCGLSLVVAPVLFWDSRRWAVAPSPWELSVRNYGTLALLPMDRWWPRLQSWAELAWHLTTSWLVWGLILLLAIVHLVPWRRNKRTRKEDALDSVQPTANASRHSQTTLLLALWAIIFLLAHIVTSVQVWDRYLLPVAPVLALTAGWLATRWLTHAAPPLIAGALAVWLCVLALPAITAARGELPIGGDHGAYTGLAEAAAWLQQEAPDNVVLYHRVLGWNLRFYLYDQIARGQYELRWFPSTAYLADNATKAPHKLRLLMEPDWAPLPDLSAMLAMRGFDLHEHRRFGHFLILEIAPRAQGFCSWCLCKPQQNWPALILPGGASMMSHR